MYSSCTSINLSKCHLYISEVSISYVIEIEEHEIVMDTIEFVKCMIKPFDHLFFQPGTGGGAQDEHSMIPTKN